MRKAFSDWEGGVTVGGERISNLRCVDDTTIVAATEGEMAALLRMIERGSMELGLIINRERTKRVVVDEANRLHRINELGDLEVVKSYVYVGSIICSEGGCDLEVEETIQ